MFSGLFQPTHLIIILIIALMVFGPGKIPEIGKAFGEMVGGFRKATNDKFETDADSPSTPEEQKK